MISFGTVQPFVVHPIEPVRGGGGSVFGQRDASRSAANEAARVMSSAPFPIRERTALADAIGTVGRDFNIHLKRKRDWISRGGRFATELEIDGRLSGSMAENAVVLQKVSREIVGTGVWTQALSHKLEFKSKRQINALSGTKSSFSTSDGDILNIKSLLIDPVLVALALGCAALIRSDAVRFGKGAAEYRAIVEAVKVKDPMLARKLLDAADGERRLREELAALEGAVVTMARTLELEARTRAWYIKQIKEMSLRLLSEAGKGDISWPLARLQAHAARGTLMEDARKRGTVLGRKLAEALKEVNLSIAEVNAKTLNENFGGRSLESLTKAEFQSFNEIIITKTGESNPDVNKQLKIAGRIGKGLFVLTLAVAAYSVYMADNKVREFARQTTILGGGALGGVAAGGLAVAVVGTAASPVIVVFVAGSIIVGGILAALGAEFAFDELID